MHTRADGCRCPYPRAFIFMIADLMYVCSFFVCRVLVDLAGSENVKVSGVEGEALREVHQEEEEEEEGEGEEEEGKRRRRRRKIKRKEKQKSKKKVKVNSRRKRERQCQRKH